ncbi:solute carrier family 22 member 7-like isoform X1 [Hydractinia symbiolongicarpus]|uniref:solute carrier family 22 member 7-like isoform X1 n=1 Tax=Hydractinia symbiolongicarpus TaxID=13093 RepID=UPI00255114B0|nr:solute carrier family 22 member 7-like isoform X1 [Hydractinia symbiolongicarpus]
MDQPLLFNDYTSKSPCSYYSHTKPLVKIGQSYGRPTKPSNYQEIMVSSIGGFGRTQAFILASCSLTKFFIASSMIMMSFGGAEPDWWIESVKYNSTDNTTTITRQLKKCPTNNNETIFFDDTMFTIVSEWSLVCSRDWIPTVITTVQMVGVLLGAGIMGPLGDLIGRKRSVLLVYVVDLVLILLIGLSVNWHMMAVVILFLGFSLGGFLVLVSVYALEFISTEWRTIMGIVPIIAWGIGVVLFGIAIKIIPHWRHLCYTIAGLGAPFAVMLWYSPESLRWLFIHGKKEEGIKSLRKIAKANRRPEPDIMSTKKLLEESFKPDKSSAAKYSYFVLLKRVTTRYKIIIFSYMWFNCAFTYYALTLGVSDLSGDMTLNMTLMGLGESICLVFVYLLTKCLGRRYTTMFLFICTSLSSFGVTIAYFSSTSKFELAMNVLALTSRFFLAAAWGSLIIFTTESFPTIVRSSAFGFASVFGRVGGIIAPQNKFLRKVSVHLPFTVNGTLALISGLLCLFLMNTHDIPMEDHFQEERTNHSQEEAEL